MEKENYNYSIDKYIFIEVIRSDEKSMKITLNINDDTNRAYIVLDGETIYNKSAIYKLPYGKEHNFMIH